MSFHYTRWPIVAVAAVSLSGCGLDALEGKQSDAQVAQERREALVMPVPAEPAVLPVAAPCEPQWRIYSCGPDGEQIEWVW